MGEVLIGLIQADPTSSLHLAPTWTPTLPGRDRTFRLIDILAPIGGNSEPEP